MQSAATITTTTSQETKEPNRKEKTPKTLAILVPMENHPPSTSPTSLTKESLPTTDYITKRIFILQAATHYIPILGSHFKNKDVYTQYLRKEIAYIEGLSTDQLSHYMKEIKQKIEPIMEQRRKAEEEQKARIQRNLKQRAEALIHNLMNLQNVQYDTEKEIFLTQEMMALKSISDDARNLSDEIKNLKIYITDLESRIRQLQTPIAGVSSLADKNSEVKVADPTNISLDSIGFPSPQESSRERRSSSTSSLSKLTTPLSFIASFSDSNKNDPSVPTDATNVAAASTAPLLGRSSESS